MGTISVSLPSDGSTASVSQYNTPINQLVNVVNGNLDSDNLAANAVTTAKIADANVTPDKLGTGAAVSSVATSQTTSTQTYVDLATAGPAVTVTIGANGLALVILTAVLGSNTASSAKAYVGFAVSGANTVAAADTDALMYQVYAANASHQGSYAKLMTGLTAGSTTFTMKYRVSGDTGTFANRKITVIPL